MTRDYNNIPANACTFAAPIEVGTNGDEAKTAPFNILARSSKPIEHWYWGNVVHDAAGAFGKDRIPIDYNHDEVIGFANKRQITNEGVRLSGALTSVIPGDRADIVMKQAQAGVPFEASINFGGDGIKIEEVHEGQSAQVNGYEFAGPGVIIREWPLRGCAFCPYGADGNTETQLFSDSGTVSATLLQQGKEVDMESPDNTVAKKGKEPVELAQVDAVEEVETANEEATELSQTVEEETVEVAEATVDAVEAEVETTEEATFSASQIADMVTEFGQEIALKTVTNGGTYEDARELHLQAERDELVALRKENAELKARKGQGTKPAAAFSVDSPAKPAKKKIGEASVRRTK